jgi:hypothetical protein
MLRPDRIRDLHPPRIALALEAPQRRRPLAQVVSGSGADSRSVDHPVPEPHPTRRPQLNQQAAATRYHCAMSESLYADILRALGLFLDQQGATSFGISGAGDEWSVAWDRGQRLALRPHELDALRDVAPQTGAPAAGYSWPDRERVSRSGIATIITSLPSEYSLRVGVVHCPMRRSWRIQID